MEYYQSLMILYTVRALPVRLIPGSTAEQHVLRKALCGLTWLLCLVAIALFDVTITAVITAMMIVVSTKAIIVTCCDACQPGPGAFGFDLKAHCACKHI